MAGGSGSPPLTEVDNDIHWGAAMPGRTLKDRITLNSTATTNQGWTVVTDPGASGIIGTPGDTNGLCILSSGLLFTTRTGQAPAFEGQIFTLRLGTDGGSDLSITWPSTIAVVNGANCTTAQFGAATSTQDQLTLVAVTVSGSLVWRVLNDTGIQYS